MVEAKNQGVSEAAASDLEAAKEEARSMLEAGSSVEEIEAATKLGRNQILGIKGSMAKANKKALEKTEVESSGLGKANQEEASLVDDLRDEAKLTGAAVTLARNQNRLKAVAPGLYDALHGKETQTDSSPSRALIDLEVLREIKAMRTADEGSHRNNNGDSQATLGLQKQIDELREERRKKDFDDLKGEIAELRQDLRHSTNSGSDLAVVVREASGLLEKVVTHDGVLRRYLAPDNVPIQPRGAAPVLRAPPAEAQGGLVDVLRAHGLVTKIIERQTT